MVVIREFSGVKHVSGPSISLPIHHGCTQVPNTPIIRVFLDSHICFQISYAMQICAIGGLISVFFASLTVVVAFQLNISLTSANT